uniref:Alpha-macroglobulin receptor-binding domain-containing protein n=1 Tax=Cyprinus carpio TaxID=7962 RepID=A0A8C2HF74_CYPCA
MDLNVSCCWKWLLLVSFLIVCVNGQTSGPYFMVTFPAVIESGSEAKLCASLLKPNESLVMNIYLVHGDQSTLLLQEKAEEEFHRCFNFKAPLVKAESVQRMKVELHGESFKMTEERKVMFKPYNPLTFIQTDKPIYNPGQTGELLTAFVLRSFGKAQKYIFIDPHIIQSAKEWLISRRYSYGCFIQQGRLFNNRMKGGVNDNVTMTAYITASLLELETPVTDPVVSKGLSCLRSVVKDVKNTYTTALLAYTFSLARDMDTQQQLFKKLEDVAISDGSHLHWSQSASADDSESLEVEISSYVLLAVLTADSLTTADLGFANRIVSWLVKQQNAYGGFSSTQDTVVALQALSLYATKVFSSDGSSTVTVQSAGDTHLFDVNQDNKLLYQEKQLQNVPAKYSIEVKGSTCVSVQVAQFYNIPTPTEDKTLRIDAKLEGDCKTLGQTFILKFTVKYHGLQERTNMVIVDIKLLSGFTADTSMIQTSSGRYASLVERVDAKDDHVIMYLKEIPKNIPMNYQIQMKQVLPVKNLQPAVVKVYDYYQTSDQSETEYSFHCQ